MNPATYPAPPPLPTLEQVVTPTALAASFDRLLMRHYDVVADEPRMIAGADRIQLSEFRRDADLHMRAIERKVIQGRYTFAPFLGVDIPKPGSKDKRPLSIGAIRDTLVQRGLYEYLYPRVDPLLQNAIFGYRSGRSAHAAIDAIRQHVADGRTWVVDVDLTRFFDTVDHALLLDKLSQLAVDNRVHKLVFRYLRTGRVDPAQVAAERGRKQRQRSFTAPSRTLGIPQGGVLSGLLSNLYLSQFDASVVAKHDGYVRYADDFVVCCTTQQECASAYALIQSEIATLCMSVNAAKSRESVPIADGIDFLGFRVTDTHVRVRGRNIHKFKNRVRNVITSQRVHRTPDATLRSLAYRLNFKIRGPNEEQKLRLVAQAGVKNPHLRSWIGFFRVVTDVEQVRQLDRWIRREMSGFMWRTHRTRVSYTDMRQAGLRSLVGALYDARRQST